MLAVMTPAVAESRDAGPPLDDLGVFACGMAVAGMFLGLGQLIQKFIPSIHAYAWMILLMVLVKILGRHVQHGRFRRHRHSGGRKAYGADAVCGGFFPIGRGFDFDFGQCVVVVFVLKSYRINN